MNLHSLLRSSSPAHLRTSEAIARTGFVTSVISYAIFWIADIIHPGFVSDYFSVHIFLLAAIAFAGWMLALEG